MEPVIAMADGDAAGRRSSCAVDRDGRASLALAQHRPAPGPDGGRMDDQPLARLIDAMHETIQGHAAQLDALDEAIGDGDHGTNLARGFAARGGRARPDRRPAAGPGAAGDGRHPRARGRRRRRHGITACCSRPWAAPRRERLARPRPSCRRCCRRASRRSRPKGGARKGEKTLLDVLIPVAQSVRSLVAAGNTGQLGGRIVAAAAHGLHQTTHMEAKHGLAADLGVASINRLDAGACSCALLFGAAVGALEPAPEGCLSRPARLSDLNKASSAGGLWPGRIAANPRAAGRWRPRRGAA